MSRSHPLPTLWSRKLIVYVGNIDQLISYSVTSPTGGESFSCCMRIPWMLSLASFRSFHHSIFWSASTGHTSTHLHQLIVSMQCINYLTSLIGTIHDFWATCGFGDSLKSNKKTFPMIVPNTAALTTRRQSNTSWCGWNVFPADVYVVSSLAWRLINMFHWTCSMLFSARTIKFGKMVAFH